MTNPNPDDVYLAEWEAERDRDMAAAGEEIPLDPADEFWTARPVLDHIRTWARARRAGPWAVLGVVLARIVAQTPPYVVLPGPGSLNLFVGLVGPPGGGKGRATTTAEQAIDMTDEVFHTVGVGSGEGLAHLYARRNRQREVEMHSTAILMDVAEIDTLNALGNRNSATIMPELRKAWMGERLGFSYADPEKRLPVRAHSYRMTGTFGIQPKRAGALLNHSDGGTPQRFLWLPVVDPYAPEIKPEQPPPWGWTWKLPVNHEVDLNGYVTIPLCPSAVRQIDNYDLLRVRGGRRRTENGTQEELEAHAMFSQAKIAAALGLLEGHLEVTEEDWFLASIVKAESDRQRNGVVHALAQVNELQNKAQGYAEGVRAVVATEMVVTATTKRVGRRVMDHLRKTDDWISHSIFRKRFVSADRETFDAVVEDLVISGQVDMEEVQNGRRYRLSQRSS